VPPNFMTMRAILGSGGLGDVWGPGLGAGGGPCCAPPGALR
jgi:hypothetical protein